MEASEYYEKHYEAVNNSGIVGWVAKLTHITLERAPFSKIEPSQNHFTDTILEVGAGQGQHFKYVKYFDKYVMTDLRPQLLNRIENKNKRVVIEKNEINAEDLPYTQDSFDRLIATCLLIHLPNPETALIEWRRVVKSGGVISIYVPCETGLILRFMQNITSRRKQKKLGINAGYIHYQEHRYNFPFLISLINKVFPDNVCIRKFPFMFGSFDLNLWAVVTVKNFK